MSSAAAEEKTHRLLIALMLGLITFATFSNSFEADFTLDGKFLIVDTARVHAATLDNLRLILTHDHWWPDWVSGVYRPLTNVSFLLEYAGFGYGTRAFGYHVTNLLLHWLNSVLVFELARRIIRHRESAVFAAVLFSVHPITADVVTNLAGRADLLATAAVLGGLLLYIRSKSRASDHKPLAMIAAAGVMTAGAFCKESALIGLPVCVLYDIAMDEGSAAGSLIRRNAPTWSILAIPTALLFAARHLVYLAGAPAPILMTENNLAATDFWTARLTACKVFAKNLALLLWPAHLSWDYSVNQVKLFRWTLADWEHWQVVVALVGLAAIVAVTCIAYRRSRPCFFYALMFLIALLPTSNLLVLIPAVMAERYLYLPLVGFSGCAGLLAYCLAGGHTATSLDEAPGSLLLSLLLAMIMLLCAARTYWRNFDWRNDATICSSSVVTTPDSFRGHMCLAGVAFRSDPQRHIDLAISEAELAQSILERNAPAAADVPGYVLDDLGKYYRVKATLLAATQGSAPANVPESVNFLHKAVDAFSRAAAWQERTNDEQRQRQLAHGKAPREVEDVGIRRLYEDLGGVYLELDEATLAVEVLHNARHFAPNNSGIYVVLADAQAKLGGNEAAIISLLQAFIINPARDDVQRGLFAAYQQLAPDSCAFSPNNGAYRLDENCPLVRRHICQAFDDLVAIFLKAGRQTEADAARETATHTHGCALQAVGRH